MQARVDAAPAPAPLGGAHTTAPADERRGAYVVSCDPARVDPVAVHAYLARSYWSPGVPADVVRRAIAHSLCCGLYHDVDGQVGFARAITDRATYAYLADVYVLEAHRGRGLGVWLVGALLAHPALAGLRRVTLMTRDAHGLYARFGFGPSAAPDRFMERVRAHPYAPTGTPNGMPDGMPDGTRDHHQPPAT
jgi:GNAT superfamily N-acetyltransferase